MSVAIRVEAGWHFSVLLWHCLLEPIYQLCSFLQIKLKVIIVLDFMLVSNINQKRYDTKISLGNFAYLLSCMTYVYIITEG